jgi:two-component system response regulator WspF
MTGVEPLVEKIATIAKLVGASTDHRRAARSDDAATTPRLLVIGASTGGPKAVADLLVPLPRDWNVAVVVVQHVDVAFSQGLAKWLAERTGHAVRVAEGGERPQAGTVLVAGTNDHIVLSKGRTLEYREEPRDVFFRPSVDVFFESVADHWPQPGTAVLLTGMGRDGARGMSKLRGRGWHTIAQDEATSVVWSMPKAAIDLGAAAEVLAIERMQSSIISRMQR